VAKATGWQALRPLHFGVLRKQPGAAMTSWHRDKDVIPSDAPILTCWIPFTPVQEGSGLYYAEGTARLEPQEGCLNDENGLKPLLLQSGMPMTSTSAFQPGDVDLHNGVVWHCGLPNRMAEPRLALAACFIPDGARLNPDPIGFNPARGATLRRRIRELYFPQLAPGDPLQGEAHPVIRPS
jgi:ectoine hydroxylase-related dioxygenase (phytanoyl-CoA dioxygenase family)